MKIDDNQPLDDPSLNTDDLESNDVDSQQTQPDDQPSAFSQMLAKKRALDRQTASARTEKAPDKGKESSFAAKSGFMPQQPVIHEMSSPVKGVDAKHSVQLPPDLQQLVREISVVMNKAGNEQVHIEMNSNVLKGLQIRIERQQGELAIQFTTDSAQVSTLLSRNIEALSQSLSNLGENGVNIRITGTKDSAKTWDGKFRGSQSGRAAGGYGGGRR